MESSTTYQLSDCTQNIDIYALRYEHRYVSLYMEVETNLTSR